VSNSEIVRTFSGTKTMKIYSPKKTLLKPLKFYNPMLLQFQWGCDAFINRYQFHQHFTCIFLPIFWRQKNSTPKHSFVIFGAKITNKSTRKTLMKLTADVSNNVYAYMCFKDIMGFNGITASHNACNKNVNERSLIVEYTEDNLYTAGVNFIHILLVPFSYESVLSSFSLITVWLFDFLAKEYWVKSCS